MVFVKALCVVLFLYSARFGASRSPEKEDSCSKKSSLPVVQKSQRNTQKTMQKTFCGLFEQRLVQLVGFIKVAVKSVM